MAESQTGVVWSCYIWGDALEVVLDALACGLSLKMASVRERILYVDEVAMASPLIHLLALVWQIRRSKKIEGVLSRSLAETGTKYERLSDIWHKLHSFGLVQNKDAVALVDADLLFIRRIDRDMNRIASSVQEHSIPLVEESPYTVLAGVQRGHVDFDSLVLRYSARYYWGDEGLYPAHGPNCGLVVFKPSIGAFKSVIDTVETIGREKVGNAQEQAVVSERFQGHHLPIPRTMNFQVHQLGLCFSRAHRDYAYMRQVEALLYGPYRGTDEWEVNVRVLHFSADFKPSHLLVKYVDFHWNDSYRTFISQARFIASMH